MVRIILANILQNPEHTPLIHQFFRLRRSVFVDRLSWPLSVHDDLEFEQYDIIPLAHYVLAVSDGQVVGGARLLRCDTTMGTGAIRYSYMIRDAWRGVIDLPRELCTDEPTISPKYWEFTRFAVSSRDPKIASGILRETLQFLQSKGACGCLFLGPPAFLRIARRHGFEPTVLGPLQMNDDGLFVAFKCELANRALLPKR